MDDLKEILDAAKAETTIACWADIRPRVSAHCRTTLSSGRATHQLEEMAPDLAAEVLRLRAEVERLTGALRKAEDGDFQQCLANYRAIRRAALKGTTQ